jgi:hypothetical protein
MCTWQDARSSVKYPLFNAALQPRRSVTQGDRKMDMYGALPLCGVLKPTALLKATAERHGARMTGYSPFCAPFTPVPPRPSSWEAMRALGAGTQATVWSVATDSGLVARKVSN